MDGVVNRGQKNRTVKRPPAKGVRQASAHQVNAESHGEPDYHVFELGRPYKRGGVGHNSYFDNSPHVETDVRETLQLKESDHTCSSEGTFPVKYQEVESSVSQSELLVEQEDEIDDGHHGRFAIFDLPIFRHESDLHSVHITSYFAAISGVFISILSFVLFIGTAFAVKGHVEGAGDRAIASLKSAMYNLNENDLLALGDDIDAVHQEFVYASKEMDKINSVAKFLSRIIPGASKLSSGGHIVEAGKSLTHTVKEFNDIIPTIIDENKKLTLQDGEHISYLELYRALADYMSDARYDIAQAQQHLDKVYLDDIPSEYRESFMHMREILGDINTSLRIATESRTAVEDMLGANGPRTYLLLFQNNHEMRATGGFIGSYGIIKVNDGQVEKMIVDDIYNPDGQLIDKIVPPLPIQKISANWSLHDSNWFTDFPVSARKAIDFYERTGGPTVDGVVAVTPSMMEKFLEITGPVEMQDHNITLTHENFMRVMQDKIEDRDNYTSNSEGESEGSEEIAEEKEQRQPKKILSDLLPYMIDRLSFKGDSQKISRVVSAVSDGLKERQIIMYTTNDSLQEIIENSGWSGSVLDTDRDYLSVVNSNINGFKTDGVIDEEVSHTAEIDSEGYIINTVRIKRTHNGGRTGYPWWDAVNSNYMRLYVPQGSKLISVEGHTREINQERLDYDALGYERDHDVLAEEGGMHIDDETGTRIYDEFGKTVFANWVYVSPQESATVTYTYRLPFRAKFEKDDDGKFGSYAIVFQKQSGSRNSVVESKISLDNKLSQEWHSHGNEQLMMENRLDIDRYHGVVFRMK